MGRQPSRLLDAVLQFLRVGFGRAAPCTCRGHRASNGQSQSGSGLADGLAGRCGAAGHAVNPPPGSGPAAGGCAFGHLRSSASQAKRPHPWGLDGAIHGANGPALPHRPTSDRFPRLLVGVDLGRHGGSTPCVDAFRSILEIFDFDRDSSTHGVDLPQIAGNCRRRGGSGCGGVSRMDAATELTWTYLQRHPQPDPPRHPSECGFCFRFCGGLCRCRAQPGRTPLNRQAAPGTGTLCRHQIANVT